MVKTIYVGNLPFNASEDDVRNLFSQYGAIHSVKMITDRETGKPRGFCFVEIEQDGANSAIEALNGADFQGRNLRVNEAREKTTTRRR
jgi:RNA recognition motif-containing protein